jgi:hypothetical protein
MKRDPDDDRGDHLVPLSDSLSTSSPPCESPPPRGWPEIQVGVALFTSTGAARCRVRERKTRLDAEIASVRQAAGEGSMPHWTTRLRGRPRQLSKRSDRQQDHRPSPRSPCARRIQGLAALSALGFLPQKLEAIETWARYCAEFLSATSAIDDLVEQVDFKLLVTR